ncbi:hypothetical protein HYW76_04250 [Candidatus Pacearchaeota archaeon]|nr:hypothetical protein [Candidatus Pacearchaeota archaeon]
MAEKKKFIEIELPLVGEKAEVLTSNELSLNGKTINLDLTRKLRGKSVEAIFKLKLEGEKIKAELNRLHLLGYFIRRMMKTSIDYVEDSFSAQCKDAVLKIKVFMITRKKVSRAVRNALRNKAKEEVEASIKEANIETIFSEILYGKFQKSLSIKLKKVYPLGLCEIRDIIIEKKLENKVEEEKIN